ncbi:MAG: ribonuclease J [Lachnospiraceae bacterium]
MHKKPGRPASAAKKEKPGKIRIVPLGGLEQIGLNMTVIEYEDTIIVVDCGMAFADDTLLGIDLIIPDITYLKQNRNKVKALFVTHGHEDHIGAIPYVLREINIPIYATGLSVALIKKKISEHRQIKDPQLHTVSYGQPITYGKISVEFIRTNHSISDAAALAIKTPAGVLVHTGDFKVDYTPVYGDAIDLWRFAELGKEGVLAVMCDSTNSQRAGFTMSEKKVGEKFDAIFAENAKNRLIIATFASNVDRVQQVINSAYKYKRKVVLEGRSMVNVIETATELGYIKMPPNTLISIDEIKNYPDNKIVLITTGSQGEPMAALSRIAANTHKKISIKRGDVIVFSSHPIPGNEKAVAGVMNELSQMGAEVIFQQTHVSGHACQEEIKLLYALLKPKYLIPVHGEYRHRQANALIGYDMGYKSNEVLLIETGDVVELDSNSCKVVDRIQAGGIYVDNSGVADVGRTIIQDRKDLSEKGVLIVTVCIDKRNGFIVSGPEVFTRGWAYSGDSEKLIEEIKEMVYNALESYLVKNHYNRGKTKMVIADAVRKYVRSQNNYPPMVLPFILEIEE